MTDVKTPDSLQPDAISYENRCEGREGAPPHKESQARNRKYLESQEPESQSERIAILVEQLGPVIAAVQRFAGM